MLFSQDSIPEPDYDNFILLFQHEPSKNISNGVLQAWANKAISGTNSSLASERHYICPSDGYIKAMVTEYEGTKLSEGASFMVALTNEQSNMLNPLFIFDYYPSSGGANNMQSFTPVKKGNHIVLGKQYDLRVLPSWVYVQFIPVKYRDLTQS